MANEFKVKNGLIVSGSTRISGSIVATSFTGSFSGSLTGTASWATNVVNGGTIDTGSFATTGSNTFKGAQVIQNNLTVTGTASFTYLNVTYESASVIYSTGSNQFGDAMNDTQLLVGLTKITGSAEITGSLKFLNGGVTGSLFGTATTASYALSSSVTVSSSFASTASYVLTAQTASYVLTAKTASYFDTTNLNQNVVVNSGYYLQVNTYSKTFSGDVPNMDSIGSPWNVVQVNFTTYPHKSIFVRYVLDDALTPGANMRAGTIMVVSDGSGNINLTEVTTQDIGDTTPVDFTAAISSGKNQVRATVTSGTWNVYFDYTII